MGPWAFGADSESATLPPTTKLPSAELTLFIEKVVQGWTEPEVRPARGAEIILRSLESHAPPLEGKASEDGSSRFRETPPGRYQVTILPTAADEELGYAQTTREFRLENPIYDAELKRQVFSGAVRIRLDRKPVPPPSRISVELPPDGSTKELKLAPRKESPPASSPTFEGWSVKGVRTIEPPTASQGTGSRGPEGGAFFPDDPTPWDSWMASGAQTVKEEVFDPPADYADAWKRRDEAPASEPGLGASRSRESLQFASVRDPDALFSWLPPLRPVSLNSEGALEDPPTPIRAVPSEEGTAPGVTLAPKMAESPAPRPVATPVPSPATPETKAPAAETQAHQAIFEEIRQLRQVYHEPAAPASKPVTTSTGAAPTHAPAGGGREAGPADAGSPESVDDATSSPR